MKLVFTTKPPKEFDHDAWVKKLPEYSFLMSLGWVQFLKKWYGENFRLYYGLEGDQVRVLLPVIFINAKRGKILRLQHAPIFSYKALYAVTVLGKSLDFLVKLAKKHSAWLLRFAPYIPVEDFKPLVSKIELRHGIKKSTMPVQDFLYSLQLDLTQPYEKIFKHYRRTIKKQIRRAQRLGLRVRVYSKPPHTVLNAFFRFFQDTIKQKGWRDRPMAYYRTQFKHLKTGGIARLFMVYYNHTPILGSVYEFYGDRVYAHYTGYNFKYRRLPAAEFLRDFVIRYAQERGYKVFDFGGIGPLKKGDQLYGVTFHKLGFVKLGVTGRIVEYGPTYDVIIHPLGYLTRMYEKLERYLKRIR